MTTSNKKRSVEALDGVRRPPDGVTWTETARIIGCSRNDVAMLLGRGLLPAGRCAISREEAEALAAHRLDWRRHASDEDGYWVISRVAARLLGVSPQRLRQLGDKDFIPFVAHQDGVRLYRREQLLTIANARGARWH